MGNSVKLPPRKILLDCDGTIMTNNYPFIGEEIDHCIHVLKRLRDNGHEFILHTMRPNGYMVDDVIEWLKNRDIEVKYVMCNPEFETGSRKVYGNLSIDDHNLGCPLIHDTEIHSKPFVDWKKVEQLLEEKGYL
jgi:hypothetical protein